MSAQFATLLRYHLLDRLRRHTRKTSRAVILAIVTTGWVATGYSTVAFMQRTDPHGAALITMFGSVFGCLIFAGSFGIEGARPTGAWARLTFFPLRQHRIAGLVIAENVILTLLATFVLSAPGLVALFQYHLLPMQAVPALMAVVVVLSATIVAWVTLLGLLASRLSALPWLPRYTQEIVSSAFTLLNWFPLLGLWNKYWFFSHVPSICAMNIVGHAIEPDKGLRSDIICLASWLVLPCLVLVFVPLRRHAKRAGAADLPRRAAARRSTVIARANVSLLRLTVQRFYVQFLRRPSLARLPLIISLSTLFLVWAIIAVGSRDAHPLGSEYLLGPRSDDIHWLLATTLLFGGLFALAAMQTSLILPMEKANVVFLRLAPRPIAPLLARGQFAALLFPVAMWLLGSAFLLWRGHGDYPLALYLPLGGAVVMLGSSLGMFTGVLFGRYDWQDVTNTHEFSAGLITVAAAIGVMKGSIRTIVWAMEPVAGISAARPLLIALAGVVVLVASTKGASILFKRRSLDDLGVRAMND